MKPLTRAFHRHMSVFMSPNRIAFVAKINSLVGVASRQELSFRYFGGDGDFANLSEQEQILAVTGLSKYSDLLQDLEHQRLDFKNSQHLTGGALKKLNIFLDDGVFEKIGQTDYVEIYSMELVPMFKSVNFWGTSSYPLDVLYSESYDRLFERLPFFQAALNRSAMKIFTGEETFIQNPVPPHVAWEKQGNMSCEIVYKFIAAVYSQDGLLAGGICVSQLKPLSQ